jgi:DNA-binding MarR family transcriptional regulator
MEATFGYLVSDIARLLRRVFDQRARTVGLSLAQGRALVYLAHHEGINQAGFAELLELQPISLARLLDRMEGWIERRPDPDDRRAYRLHLTDKARPMLALVRDLAAQSRAEALLDLSEAEKDVLMRLLTRVHDNLSEREPAGWAAPESVDHHQDGTDDRLQ